MDKFSHKKKKNSKISSRSRSRSLSFDLSLKSKNRNLFNQSFDSKLSEFSDNSETLILSKPKKIREYEQNEDDQIRLNSLKKQLQRKERISKIKNEYGDLKEDNQYNQKKIKNFTFSKNNGGKSSRQGGKKLFLDLDLDENFENERDNQKIKKKVDLKLPSPKNFSDFSGGKNKSEKSEKSEIEFELSLPTTKLKKPKFKLALDINEVNEEAEKTREQAYCPKPPSLGKNKKFNMAGSSWGNLGFSLGTGQQKVLNAPRNNKKVSFNFGSDIVNRNLRQNFQLGSRNKFASKLQIVIPEENSREVDYESDEPELELPSLRERQSRKSTQGNKKFDLIIDNEDKNQKVIMIDEFQDSVSDRDLSQKSRKIRKNRRNINYQNDRTSSNSPRHVSGVSESNSEGAKQWNQNCSTKNLEIRFDSNLMNLTMGNKNENDIFSGCRTNPLPTCKNANQKYKGFGFGGPSRKKRHLTVSLTGEETFINNPKKEKRTLCIDEVSNDEMQSNSGGEDSSSGGKIHKKRSLKMKINSKNSEFTNKNFSKQSSQIINSIQSK